MGYERRVKPPAHPPPIADRQPRLSPAASDAAAERRAREAQALRANLLRRKRQSRARRAADTPEDEPR